MAELKAAVQRLIDSANAYKAEVEPLKAAVAEAAAKHAALVEAEDAEDVGQNADLSAAREELAKALADAQEAADALTAAADELDGATNDVPVDEVPADPAPEVPAEEAPVNEEPAAPVEEAPAVERDADGNPVVR